MRWYACPDGERYRLGAAPQLASWDNSRHPSQLRLQPFLDGAETLLAGSRIDSPWALRLDVGRPAHQNLLHGADLDNYVQPLAERLDDPGLMSVWCTKQHGEQSFIRLEAAREVLAPPHDVLVARPTASYESPVYKAQVKAAVADASMLPPGSVKLQLAFHVGPRLARICVGTAHGQAPGPEPYAPGSTMPPVAAARSGRLRTHLRCDASRGSAPVAGPAPR